MIVSLPYIYFQPQTQDDWTKWAWNHGANHYDLVAAVQDQKNQQLQIFVMSPVDPDNLGLWLYQHQTMHNQVNAALGTPGYDLLSLDWDDPDQFAQWLRLNGDEHQRLSAALGVG